MLPAVSSAALPSPAPPPRASASALPGTGIGPGPAPARRQRLGCDPCTPSGVTRARFKIGRCTAAAPAAAAAPARGCAPPSSTPFASGCFQSRLLVGHLLNRSLQPVPRCAHVHHWAGVRVPQLYPCRPQNLRRGPPRGGRASGWEARELGKPAPDVFAVRVRSGCPTPAQKKSPPAAKLLSAPEQNQQQSYISTRTAPAASVPAPAAAAAAAQPPAPDVCAVRVNPDANYPLPQCIPFPRPLTIHPVDSWPSGRDPEHTATRGRHTPGPHSRRASQKYFHAPLPGELQVLDTEGGGDHTEPVVHPASCPSSRMPASTRG